MKLIEAPAGVATLRAELRRFEEERGLPVAGVMVKRPEMFKSLSRILAWMGVALPVWYDSTVRDGHVVLVGGAVQ